MGLGRALVARTLEASPCTHSRPQYSLLRARSPSSPHSTRKFTNNLPRISFPPPGVSIYYARFHTHFFSSCWYSLRYCRVGRISHCCYTLGNKQDRFSIFFILDRHLYFCQSSVPPTWVWLCGLVSGRFAGISSQNHRFAKRP